MKHQRHFDPSSVALREVAQISALISDLDRCGRLIDSEIVTEEERAGVSDRFNGAYPVLARSLTAGRENLKRTIAALGERLASRLDEGQPTAAQKAQGAQPSAKMADQGS